MNDSFNKEDFTVLEPQVLHRLQNKEKQCRTILKVRFWLLKRVFECSIAWCDMGLGRTIVLCQRNHLRKPKSRNRAILSAHFSGVKFCMHLDQLFFGFLVPLDALRGVVFLEVSDNPHLSLRQILNITTVFCFLVKLLNCQMSPLKRLFVRLWNLWPPFALGPGC